MLLNLYHELKEQPSNPLASSRYYKTGAGAYAHHDRFLGIPMPILRKLSLKYLAMTHSDLAVLIASEVNEHRMLALLILIAQDKKLNLEEKKCFNFYIAHLSRVNNWNLVDLSCHEILGRHLLNEPHELLYTLSSSPDLWERRIAIVTTWRFIRNKQYDTTLRLVLRLINDSQDLIHKACGWMLREVGKKDLDVLINFLDSHANNMPRTTLRYAIERLPEESRLMYLAIKKSPIRHTL